jgi:hypothetical protein
VTLAAEKREYVSLMRGVELVMSDPGSHDLPVSRIFTNDMFLDLRQELADQVLHPQEHFENAKISHLQLELHSCPDPLENIQTIRF